MQISIPLSVPPTTPPIRLTVPRPMAGSIALSDIPTSDKIPKIPSQTPIYPIRVDVGGCCLNVVSIHVAAICPYLLVKLIAAAKASISMTSRTNPRLNPVNALYPMIVIRPMST